MTIKPSNSTPFLQHVSQQAPSRLGVRSHKQLTHQCGRNINHALPNPLDSHIEFEWCKYCRELQSRSASALKCCLKHHPSNSASHADMKCCNSVFFLTSCTNGLTEWQLTPLQSLSLPLHILISENASKAAGFPAFLAFYLHL